MGKTLSDWGVAPQSNTWALVSIPISEIPSNQFDQGHLKSILISGMVKETFYIDDMKLVARKVDAPTAVEEVSGETSMPSGYALSQNVPNPFNAQTTIRYDLPEAGAVRLYLYNLCGQRIRTLMEDQRSAGTYSVVWDGRDGTGRDVASGVYLVRLKVEGAVVQAKRMVLLR